MFRKELELLIEPYFKRAADGTLTIRGDDCIDVIFAVELPRPKTALEFKEVAAKLYLAETTKKQ